MKYPKFLSTKRKRKWVLKIAFVIILALTLAFTLTALFTKALTYLVEDLLFNALF